jgi:acid phosphatase type 7
MKRLLALFSLVVVSTSAGLLAGSLAGSDKSSAAAADPVIAAAGDISCSPLSGSFNAGLGTANACRQLYTSNLLDQKNYAAVLPLGDLQYENGSLANYLLSYDLSWGRFKQITRPVPGNHEYGTGGAAGYFDYFNGIGNPSGPAGDEGRGYYSYDVGDWHLVALNSNCGSVGGCGAGSPQETWLRQDLAANQSSCTLAYWHHPLFSSGSYRPGITSARPLFRALYENDAELVLNGHDHNYERFAPQDEAGNPDPARGVRQFIVGTGGKSNYGQGAPIANSEARNSDSFGVLELTLHPAGYEWRFVPAAGDSFTDSGSAQCHGPDGPLRSYARPESAGGVYTRLVPSFAACEVPNAVHGDAPAAASCDPPVPSSRGLTIGGPDANGSGSNFTGSVVVRAAGEKPPDSLNGDQADLEISANLADVRNAIDAGDYAGELEGRFTLRLTDSETTSPLGATAVDLPVSFAIPCTPTESNPDIGSTCSVTTSLDTLIPDAVKEGAQSVWELGQVDVLDGGADGIAATPDNAVFARVGLFAP